MTGVDPAPELKIAQHVREQTMAEAAAIWRELLAEDRARIIEEFKALFDVAQETYKRMIRKLRDDLQAKRIEDELERSPQGKPEDVIVLVVDDEPSICLQLRRLFEAHQMRVFHACDPETAMNVLDVEPIDVVLTDIRMPRNGQRLYEWIRKSQPGCEVVLMSGGEESEVAGRCLDTGAFHFLLKPFRNQQAVLTVVRAAEHRKVRRGKVR